MVFNYVEHKIISHLSVTMSIVVFVLVLCAPFGNGHLASLFDNGKVIHILYSFFCPGSHIHNYPLSFVYVYTYLS